MIKDGLIVIRKEKGWTSFDVVAKLRRVLETRKVGHTGTLDPAAEGVLPVVFGRGTRIAELLSEHDKTYRTVCRLGVVTDTQDMTGEVLSTSESLPLTQEIMDVVKGFEGSYQQVPPMYSALKVNGKKLYELAREGVSIEREPREVTIYSIKLLSMNLPLIEMEVSCSKGTYIRTLCHDIGDRLGCGAAMESLLRVRSGDFTLKDALTVGEAMEKAQEGTLEEYIWGLDKLLIRYPKLCVSAQLDHLLRNGNKIPVTKVNSVRDQELVRMCDSGGELLGLYVYRERDKLFAPFKMLL